MPLPIFLSLPCRLELGIPPEALGPSGHRRHYLVPTSPEQHVEMDKVKARTVYGASRGHLFYMFSALPKVKLIATTLLGPSLGEPVTCDQICKSSHNLGRSMETKRKKWGGRDKGTGTETEMRRHTQQWYGTHNILELERSQTV